MSTSTFSCHKEFREYVSYNLSESRYFIPLHTGGLSSYSPLGRHLILLGPISLYFRELHEYSTMVPTTVKLLLTMNFPFGMAGGSSHSIAV